MRFLGLIFFLASYAFLLATAAPAPGTSLKSSQTVTSSGADPTATILKRRRTHNCNQDDRLKNIEAQAWADAGAMAEIAAQYDNGNKWQPAMNYWMGVDSVQSENFHKIQNLLSNQQKIHRPNWIFPEAVVDIYCGDTHPTRKVCRLQKNPANPDGPMVTAFGSTWVERGALWNSYNIVLCPRFFEEKTSLEYILYHTKMGDKNSNNASEYKFSWGHTIYHELAHLDPVISGFPTYDPAYRACPAAKLANQNGCSIKKPPWTPPGWDNATYGPAGTLINADSWAFFASAVYFQNALELKEPAEAPNDCGIYSGQNFVNFTWESPEGFLLDPVDRTDGSYDAGQPSNLLAENTPPEDPSAPSLPYTATPLSPTLASPFPPGEAVAYFASYVPPWQSTTTTQAAAPSSAAPSSAAPSSAAPSSTAVADSCNCAYKFLFDQFEVSGKNFPEDKLNANGQAGAGLKKQLAGCGALTDYSFQTLTNDPRGMQWKASGRLPIGTKACVGRAVQSAGGDSPDRCAGAG